MTEPTAEPTILDPNEAALVTKDGGLELLFPEFSGDEPIPDAMTLLAAFMLRVEQEPEFVADMLQWLDGQASADLGFHRLQ